MYILLYMRTVLRVAKPNYFYCTVSIHFIHFLWAVCFTFTNIINIIIQANRYTLDLYDTCSPPFKEKKNERRYHQREAQSHLSTAEPVRWRQIIKKEAASDNPSKPFPAICLYGPIWQRIKAIMLLWSNYKVSQALAVERS